MQLYFSFHLEYLIPFVKSDFPLSFLFGKKHRGNVLERNTPTKPLFPPCFRFFLGGGSKNWFLWRGKEKKMEGFQSLSLRELLFCVAGHPGFSGVRCA